MIPM